MRVYQNVFTLRGKTYIREFDTESKETFFKEETVIPEIFIEDKDGNYSSFVNQRKLKKLNINSMKDYRETIKNYNDAGITVYGRTNPAFEYISRNFENPVDSIHNHRTWFLDIEVTGDIDKDAILEKDAWKPYYAQQGVTLIQFYDNYKQEYYILGLKELEKDLEVNDKTKKVNYIKFSSESNLLKGFIRLIQQFKPSIIVGWNTFGYDFPYLNNRIARVLDGFTGELFEEDGKIKSEVLTGPYIKAISPFRIVTADYVNSINGVQEFCPVWNGIILEDYLHLYKKYVYGERPSYSLDGICSYELEESKVEHSEFLNFMEFYEKDFQKFCEYGVKDVELLYLLDQKLKLISLAQFIACMTGVCIPNVKGTLAQWTNCLYNEAYKKGIILPSKSVFRNGNYAEEVFRGMQLETRASSPAEYLENSKWIGGFVHNTKTDWNWIISCDFASLYPSLISGIGVGADTLVTDLPQELVDLREKYFLKYTKEDTTETITSRNIEWVRNVMLNPEVREEIHNTLVKYNVSVSPNGMFFDRGRESLLSEVITNLLVERKRHKKLMKQVEDEIETAKKENKSAELLEELNQKRDYHDTTQMALKAFANGAYGILGMEVNCFTGHPDYFSNAVTASGQVADISCSIVAGEFIDQINQKLPENERVKDKGKRGFKWIAQTDTDSFYLCVEPFVKLKCKGLSREETVEKIDQFLKKVLAPKLVDHLMNTYAYTLNLCKPEIMKLDREVIADRFLSIANKAYYLRVWDNEGVRLAKPKIKIQGLAVKKMNTPAFFRDSVKEAMLLLIDKNIEGVKELRSKYEKEIREAKIEDLSITVNINSLDYKKGIDGKYYKTDSTKKVPCPINSRAALFANEYIEKNNLPFKKLEVGKASYTFLKEPNPVGSNVVAFRDPKLMDNLREYIDYNTLFEKFFDGLIEIVTEPLGWSISNTAEIIDEDW